MKLIRPTVTACVDGKEHLWTVVQSDIDVVKGTRTERRWCKKCGALIQVRLTSQGEAVVQASKNKTPHLMLPQLVKAASK